ncbi:MAG TPA: carbohydrate kinase family protein [Acidimicrobiales bacterium]|nr:carbohydrate kinase family protein [Acidimicrobiales bacterium]
MEPPPKTASSGAGVTRPGAGRVDAVGSLPRRTQVLLVGDTATDTYITLDPGVAHLIGSDRERLLALDFGAKVPYESTITIEAGGNAANAAVACARLGLDVAITTYVGADQLGRDVVAALHRERVDTSLVRLDRSSPTNRHFVLRLGGERTILVHHEPYSYHWPHLRPTEIPAWIYLSSIGRDAAGYEDEIADWLEANPAVALAFQPGTYQIARGAVALERLYRRSALLVCNREEAAAIGGGEPGDDVGDLLDLLHALGPPSVVVTDAAAGAYASDAAGRYEVPIYPDDSPVVDRTGAGDAFAATVLAELVLGRGLAGALLRAPVNAMSVVHELGTQAGLLDGAGIESRLERAPAGYGVHPLGAQRGPGQA